MPSVSQAAGHSGEVRAGFLSMVAICDLDKNSFGIEKSGKGLTGESSEEKKRIKDSRDS